MTTWDEELWRDFINNAGPESVPFMPILAAPTREDTIKHIWQIVGPDFDRYEIEGRMLVKHDLDIADAVLFERIDYAGTTVIEAEGVIVQRL